MSGAEPVAFCVYTWGCSGSAWLSRALNSHPDVLCLHHPRQRWRRAGDPDRLDDPTAMVLVRALARGSAAGGVVSGFDRASAAAVSAAVGGAFRCAALVRHPVLRVRSFVAHERARLAEDPGHADSPKFDAARRILSDGGAAGLSADRPEDLFFVHGCTAINRVVEEDRLDGPLVTLEDLVADPAALDALTRHLTEGRCGLDAALHRRVSARIHNPHAAGPADPAAVRAGWSAAQRDLFDRIVTDDARAIHARLGHELGGE